MHPEKGVHPEKVACLERLRPEKVVCSEKGVHPEKVACLERGVRPDWPARAGAGSPAPRQGPRRVQEKAGEPPGSPVAQWGRLARTAGAMAPVEADPGEEPLVAGPGEELAVAEPLVAGPAEGSARACPGVRALTEEDWSCR